MKTLCFSGDPFFNLISILLSPVFDLRTGGGKGFTRLIFLHS